MITEIRRYRRQRLATTMNNAVVVPTEQDYYPHSRMRLNIRCCSNTSLPTGNLTVPSGQNEGSFNNDGCYHFNYFINVYIPGYRANFSSYGYSGVFTCNIRDTEGNEFNSNIGIYDAGYHGECTELRTDFTIYPCRSSIHQWYELQ